MKNKFLLVILIFMLVIASFTSVFASTSVYPNDYTVPECDVFNRMIKQDDGTYCYNGISTCIDRYFVCHTDSIDYYFFVCDGYFINNKYYLNNNSVSNYIYFEYDTNGSFIRANSLRCDSSFSLWNGMSICYSSTDLYDSNGVLVFQVALPEIPEEPQQITQVLAEETEKVQIAEQLKIMIVGFLKYLIVLVISLIAFWKGWQFLSTQLRKA